MNKEEFNRRISAAQLDIPSLIQALSELLTKENYRYNDYTEMTMKIISSYYRNGEITNKQRMALEVHLANNMNADEIKEFVRIQDI